MNVLSGEDDISCEQNTSMLCTRTYGWCIFGPTPIPSTAHPTYEHVVLTAVVGPMHCRSDGHIKNSILVHPTILSLGHVSRSADGPFS